MTIKIPAGQILEITTDDLGAGTVWWKSPNGQDVFADNLIANSNNYYGPYLGDSELEVVLTGGSYQFSFFGKNSAPPKKFVEKSNIFKFDDSGKVTAVFNLDGSSSPMSNLHSEKSILIVGGDHPYKQWWGNTGSDGLFQMFDDLNIKPYIAICADESTDATSGNGATIGKGNMFTTTQAAELQRRGAEFVSHGARHVHWWEMFNTGIRVYYTGAEATPTVNISTTQLTTSTATTGATNFLFSTYTTLTSLAAAINALSGWNCIIATELTGSEPSAALVPLNAARSVTDLGGADATDSNQRFALTAGIMIRYTGTAYQKISISCNAGSNFLSLFADGARLLATTTNATLLTISNAINALNIPGLTSLVMDNGYNAQTVGGSTTLNPGQKFRETYCFGDENGTHLQRMDQVRVANGYGVFLGAGLGLEYAIKRNILAVKERASNYGVTVKSFAQSGGRLYPNTAALFMDEHTSWRGDNYFGYSPYATPLSTKNAMMGHFTSRSPSSSTPYSESDVKAIIDALSDSRGFQVNWLNHLVTPTPGDPSPYTGLNQHSAGFYASSADQDEGSFYRELVYASNARNNGYIEIITPSEAEKAKLIKLKPRNFIFNNKFRNGRSDNLLGITSAATGQFGIACPGWEVTTSSSSFSAVTVNSDRELVITTNGALGAETAPFRTAVMLERGKTYQIGAYMNLRDWGAANKCSMTLYPAFCGFGDDMQIAKTSIAGRTIYGSSALDCSFLFTVPMNAGHSPARAISLAGTYSFGGSASITIKVNNLAASSAISLVGLTDADGVATAINTAMAADATYGALGQYHSIAKVEDGRVVITAPARVNNTDDPSLLEILQTAGTPLTTLFGTGVTAVRDTSSLSDTIDTSFFSYIIGITIGTTSGTQTARISDVYCREVPQ